jgi:DNA-binding transcriptional regulator YdaS (Cro superfamily)
MLKSVEEMVDVLGGNSAAAALGGVSVPAVSNWKSRGRVPPDKFMVFSMALAKIGKTADPAIFGFKEEEARA